MFKKWTNKSSFSAHITEPFILELIRHFYPAIDIENDKYILHTRNSMWDKRGAVINNLELYKLNTLEEKCVPTLCSAYKYYITKCNGDPDVIYNVSKRYYEKVAIEELGDKLDLDGIISW